MTVQSVDRWPWLELETIQVWLQWADFIHVGYVPSVVHCCHRVYAVSRCWCQYWLTFVQFCLTVWIALLIAVKHRGVNSVDTHDVLYVHRLPETELHSSWCCELALCSVDVPSFFAGLSWCCSFISRLVCWVVISSWFPSDNSRILLVVAVHVDSVTERYSLVPAKARRCIVGSWLCEEDKLLRSVHETLRRGKWF